MLDPGLSLAAGRGSRTPPEEAERRQAHRRPLAGGQRRYGRPDAEPVVVRLLGAGDATALARLAGADSAATPAGEMLGAELGGRLVAALSLREGTVIADPFRPTAAAVELLRTRARQLTGGRPRGRLRLSLRRRARPRAVLTPSPPGGGGRLLRL